ncbi:MAG TPA: sulfotransferase, partial [Stellaceae bacterium]|nr:sulfotransferase [Stellaceae bacterium]
RGDVAEAERLYRAVIGRDPDNVEALYNLAVIQLHAGRPAETVELLDRVLSCDPAVAPAHYLRGLALAALARHHEAILCYEAALGCDPYHAEAACNLGNVLQQLGRHDEALPWHRRAVSVNPDSAEAHNNLGNGYLALNKHADAVASYERALALKPGYAEAYNNLGLAFLAWNRRHDALVCLEKAVALAPDHGSALTNLGTVLCALDRAREAVPYLEKAAALQPRNVATHAHLGIALQSVGRHGEAFAHFKTAIAIDPGNAEVHGNLACAQRELGDKEAARRSFAAAIELAPRKMSFYRDLANTVTCAAGDPLLMSLEEIERDIGSLAAADQMELHFALSKAYDDTGDYARCFRHLIEGNALRRGSAEYDEAATLRRFDRVRETFTPRLLARVHGAGCPSDVPVFIIGMPRSGSTLVEQVLASHPGVHGAGEINDFELITAKLFQIEGRIDEFLVMCRDVTPAQLCELGTIYLDRIRGTAPRARRITNKMLSNFFFAGLIHMALPGARFVHTRRDPLDTCVSIFSKVFSAQQPHTYDLADLGRYYRAYESLMSHWRGVLPPESLLDVQYEEVVADLEGQARRIVAFCGLEWDDSCLAFHKTERPVRTASALQVRQPIYHNSVGRWRRYADQLGPLIEALARN